jgi:ribosomal protein S18 acetylase RimI-like enzyme
MSSNAEDEVVLPPNPLEGVPELKTTTLITEDDKTAALKLVADSIAQQRQFASRTIMFHPLFIATYVLLLAIMTKFLYKDVGDIGIVITTGAGVSMAVLVAVRSCTAGYIHLAEEFTWAFATNEDGEQDIIIGSRYGEELIGALILRLERNSNGGGKKKSKGFKTGGEALIRAWTVRIKYRGTGVGTELLEEAIRVSREKLGNSAKIGFAVEHANSKMILPAMFNGGFNMKEAKAAKALEKTLQSMDPSNRRNR